MVVHSYSQGINQKQHQWSIHVALLIIKNQILLKLLFKKLFHGGRVSDAVSILLYMKVTDFIILSFRNKGCH